jgi:hypothetical protein
LRNLVSGIYWYGCQSSFIFERTVDDHIDSHSTFKRVSVDLEIIFIWTLARKLLLVVDLPSVMFRTDLRSTFTWMFGFSQISLWFVDPRSSYPIRLLIFYWTLSMELKLASFCFLSFVCFPAELGISYQRQHYEDDGSLSQWHWTHQTCWSSSMMMMFVLEVSFVSFSGYVKNGTKVRLERFIREFASFYLFEVNS